jgi:hypothetical protein
MGWTLARDQVISIVAETTVTTKRAGAGERFVHLPARTSSSTNLLASSRTFRIRLDGDIRGVGPLMPSAQAARTRVTATLEVDYALSVNEETQDEVMFADALALRTRLLDDTNWNRPTSTIELIFGGSHTSLMEARIERDERGARLLIPLEIEFT